jgi:translocation and assembly module TamB
MRRWVRISAIAVAAVLLGAAAGLFLLFRSPAGPRLLTPLIEDALAGAIGGEVDIGGLAGDLPGAIVATDLVFSEDGAIWLTVDRLTLRWRAWSLARRPLRIDLLHVDGAELRGPPPKRARDDARPRGFELPDRAPEIELERLALENIRIAESLAGEPARLDAVGAVFIGERRLDVTLDAASSGGRDDVSIRLLRVGDALSADATIQSDADGAVAALTGLGGPLFVAAKGDGPLTDYRLDIESRLGSFGAFAGALSGDFEALERIDFEARARLGARLAGLARLIGEDATAQGVFRPRANGGEIALSRLTGAIGAVNGAIGWRNRGGAIADIELRLNAAFAPHWRPDLQRYLGARAAVVAQVAPRGRRYLLSGSLDATLVDATFEAIDTDLRKAASGAVEARLAAHDGLPPLMRSGAALRADIDWTFDDRLAASDLSVALNGGGGFRGAAVYRTAAKTFAIDGDVVAPPALIARLAPKIAAAGEATAAIDIEGAMDDFSGRIVAAAPALRLDGRPLPASRIALAFAGAPDAPAGTIAARALDRSRRLSAKFAKSAAGVWSFSGVDYAGGDFRLAGAASFNPDTDEGAVNLVYRGDEDAEPWPGVRLGGRFTAEGAIASGAKTNRLTLRADSLAIQNIALSGLSIAAEGPSDALFLRVAADGVRIRGAAPIESAAAEGTARIDPLRFDVRSFSADVARTPMRLVAPAAIAFADGVRIDNLRARIGRDGALAFDGAFSKQRWRGRMMTREAPIVAASSILDLDLDLDTDAAIPARGTFTLTSELSKTHAARIAASFAWNGRTLDIADDPKIAGLDLALSLPARLVRAPSLRIDGDGQLAGSLRYEGRVEALAPFLPPALQSIEGALVADGTAAGTLKDPKLAGSLTLSNGAYTELSSGLSIVAIEASGAAQAAAAGSRLRFSAQGSGPGQSEMTIEAAGDIRIGADSALDARIALDHARLAAGPVSSVDASGEVRISGPFADLLAAGEITLHSLDSQVFTPDPTGLVDIEVVALNGAGQPADSAAPPASATKLRYQIRIAGDDRLFIRGRGLTSEWRAAVDLAGDSDDPLIIGSMTLLNGALDFAGRRFDVTEGALEFDRLSPNDPALDIRAERETQSGVVAAIVIAGRASAPKISLESTPSLPPEDIMALLLFDKPATELSALESLQVAEGLASLGGVGPFGGEGVTGSARRALGLDVLSFDVDEADSAASSLTIGKYVAEGLFVSATQDARGASGSVRIEYEIADDFTVETELRQDGDQKASVNWKHDF